MKTYIALLKGVNVGGHRRLKMNVLVQHLLSLGFESVTSYIQSGNLIIKTTPCDSTLLETLIEQKIKAAYGYDVSVMIRTMDQLKIILENNSFLSYAKESPESLYFTLLKTKPSQILIDNLICIAFEENKFFVGDGVVYAMIPHSYGNSKFNNTFIEKKLKTPATTRNLNTLLNLLKMAE